MTVMSDMIPVCGESTRMTHAASPALCHFMTKMLVCMLYNSPTPPPSLSLAPSLSSLLLFLPSPPPLPLSLNSLSPFLYPPPISHPSPRSILLSRVGDILESMNGINVSNGDHREAVRAVKETKEVLGFVSEGAHNINEVI